jgi:hypothetical protein
MADEDAPQCKVVYIDGAEEEETNWIKRAGKARVTYPNGCTFEGTFDDEKLKQGPGVYVWMGPSGGEDEEMIEKARYEGNYKNNMKDGVGKMVFPNKDVYEGQWFENKMQGIGTYTYNSTAKGGEPDIYSGSFIDGKKEGEGRYEFGADQSMFVGTWKEGEMSTGKWELKGAAVYTGNFDKSRPIGEGTFAFSSGLSQAGSFDAKKLAEGEEEEAPEEGAEVVPNVSWSGANIVAF